MTAAFSPDAIPLDLRTRANWVAVRFGAVRADGKRPKIPHDPRSGRKASVTSPRTWAPLADVLDACRHGQYDGIGFVLARQGIVGVDLDDCRDPENGDLDPWAEEVVAELRTYGEVSPSGTGIHLFALGELPEGRRKAGPFEVYDDKRYLTVTACRLPNSPEGIEARQPELIRLHRRFLADRPAEAAATIRLQPLDLADADLLRRAGAAKNAEKFTRLWSGDWSAYPSHSEADLALCRLLAFWTGPDEYRIGALLSQSGLSRAKWSRADYRRRTVRKAIRLLSCSYSAPEKKHPTVSVCAPHFRPAVPVDLESVKRCVQASLPDGAEAAKVLKVERLRLLCRLLSNHNQGAFLLPCRLVADVVGTSGQHASRLIAALVRTGDLERVAGDPERHRQRLADEFVLGESEANP